MQTHKIIPIAIVYAREASACNDLSTGLQAERIHRVISPRARIEGSIRSSIRIESAYVIQVGAAKLSERTSNYDFAIRLRGQCIDIAGVSDSSAISVTRIKTYVHTAIGSEAGEMVPWHVVQQTEIAAN